MKNEPIDLASVRERNKAPDPEPISHEWPTAHGQVEERIGNLELKVHTLIHDLSAVFKETMANKRWRIAQAALLATVITGACATAVSYVVQKQMDRLYELSMGVDNKRLTAIAAAMATIPETPRLRLKTGPRKGAPTVVALQEALPYLGHISARERDMACDRVPLVCQPQKLGGQ